MEAIDFAKVFFKGKTSARPEEIDNAISTVLAMGEMFKDKDPQELRRELEAYLNIQIDDFRIIETHERGKPWLNDKRSSISWNFWNRYRDYLESDKGYSVNVLNSIDLLTDRILNNLFDPKEKTIIDKRGLVVGQVQSGKTSNYSGLICKAADSGFKLIIVLAGIHNNLRSQTQQRIDESFLGFDTQFQRASNTSEKNIGVGRGRNSIIAHSLTSSLEKGDFSAGAANSLGLNFDTQEPIVAVVKKNGRVLERLKQWLISNGTAQADGSIKIRGKSLLLIDDEADNASINTNPEEDQSTKINGLIRGILGIFDKSAYVGYTATPFANIFIAIDDDDLFPQDFIVNLPAPTTYVGPQQIFGFDFEEKEGQNDVFPIVERIKDEKIFDLGKAKKDSKLPDQLPPSLVRAIRCFILTCAVRRLRGQIEVHNSMLIHISRFTIWQSQIKKMVEDEFLYYRRGIEMKIPSVLEEIRATYEDNHEDGRSYLDITSSILDSDLASFDPLVRVHSWNSVLSQLHEAASKIEVRELNGTSSDILNYSDHKNGLSVIAIGGDKLSRGLTLEGLSVSYYLRSSRMYDTLMQMGRWFGYRPGYVDLCRLFISSQLNEWFCHITLASEELRQEFEFMSTLNSLTPRDFALKVRTHPGILQISASNKIRRATEVRVSWSGRLVETYCLSRDTGIIKSNFEATKELIRNLGTPENPNGKSQFLWRDVDLEKIENFLANFEVPESAKRFSPKNLLRFLAEKRKHGELLSWNVGIISKGSGTEPYELIPGIVVRNLIRTPDSGSEDSDTYRIRKAHIITRTDEYIDLSKEEIQKLEFFSVEKKQKSNDETNSSTVSQGGKSKHKYSMGEYLRNVLRQESGKPLLNFYFLDPVVAKVSDHSVPVVGFAISFPGSKRNDAVSFAVHEQLLSVFNQEEDDYNEPEDEED